MNPPYPLLYLHQVELSIYNATTTPNYHQIYLDPLRIVLVYLGAYIS